ncbi:MAG: hypothetical protein HOF69_06605 [Campylobacteraceae bacterium]|nr:hypothetical protein [Campylobacteraceae bacterium]MBT3882911.1 hypothetical protein [Campylobacteraceae bacterium]MBT4030894.1 hypothetical protein [Campylobacteraceae bacterium]MBT4572851.1 hypothetical protein [Campylobacteraceae bacterium]MBT4707169.1 hypothetical protein [Campylobacteraceae bacterium]
MSQETRPIPKKTIIIFAVLIILGIIAYFMNEIGKSAKATKVLSYIGYKNIKEVSVAKITKFRNDDTGIEGYKYTVNFHNIESKKDCRGFLWADFKKNVIQDISCK